MSNPNKIKLVPEQIEALVCALATAHTIWDATIRGLDKSGEEMDSLIRMDAETQWMLTGLPAGPHSIESITVRLQP